MWSAAPAIEGRRAADGATAAALRAPRVADALVSAPSLRPSPEREVPPGIAAHREPVCLPRKPDVLCFSIIDWGFRYQRPQQLLSRLARAGHRVCYLSQRLLEAGDPSRALRPLAPGVTEVHLQGGPGQRQMNIYQDTLEGQTEEGLYRSLCEFMRVAGLGETVCFVQLPFWTPLALRLKADLGSRIVFDCLDDFGLPKHR